jgi:hypothetical protein
VHEVHNNQQAERKEKSKEKSKTQDKKTKKMTKHGETKDSFYLTQKLY